MILKINGIVFKNNFVSLKSQSYYKPPSKVCLALFRP